MSQQENREMRRGWKGHFSCRFTITEAVDLYKNHKTMLENCFKIVAQPPQCMTQMNPECAVNCTIVLNR